MPNTVYIVGAGVIGLSCAWQLAKHGYKAHVYHNAPIGAGASGAAAGALKPFNADQTGWKQALQQESLWQYPAFLKTLEEDSGFKVPYHRCGRLAVYHKERGWKKAQKAVALAQKKWPFLNPQAVVTSETIQSLLPEQVGAIGAIKCNVSATFSPQNMLQALFKACKNLGVTFEEREVTFIKNLKKPLIVAAGANTAHLLPKLGVTPLKRQAILLKWPYSTPLEMIVENGHVYCIPWAEKGAVYIGSTHEPEAGFSTEKTQKAEAWLREHAATLFPKLKEASLLERFVGIQNRISQEGESSLFLGPIPHKNGIFAAVGHGGVGFCMAPISAEHIVRHIKAFYREN